MQIKLKHIYIVISVLFGFLSQRVILHRIGAHNVDHWLCPTLAFITYHTLNFFEQILNNIRKTREAVPLLFNLALIFTVAEGLLRILPKKDLFAVQSTKLVHVSGRAVYHGGHDAVISYFLLYIEFVCIVAAMRALYRATRLLREEQRFKRRTSGPNQK